MTSCLTAIKNNVIKYYGTSFERNGKNLFWSIKNSGEILKSCIVCNVDLLILKIMVLFFKNMVKYSNSGKIFSIFVNLYKLLLSKQLHLC